VSEKLTHIPLTAYRDRDLQRLGVFKLTARPSFSPIDIDLEVLIEKFGWGPADRVRFWYSSNQEKLESKHKLLKVLISPRPHLLIRKIDVEEDCFSHCSVFMNGEVQILSNDENFARDFFTELFINVAPGFHKKRDWKIEAEWGRERVLVSFFLGTLNGALGWGSDKIPMEINESLFEAMRDFETKQYKSCVVMCRRAIEAILKLAYRRFFKKEPRTRKNRDLELSELLRRFEREKPEMIPKHWLNILDAIRNIGNVPGAHAKKIPHYRFSKGDAALALNNTLTFRETYFNKIDKELTRVYTLTVELPKTKAKKFELKRP